MKYEVYHAKKLISRVFDEFLVPVNFPQDFDKVAEVVTNEGLDGVFRVTNHIECAWWNNKEVTWHKDRSRSTSVGDIVIGEDKKKWICNMVGWKEIN